MDPQMKRGFIEACVLASLHERESYGYQIIRTIPTVLELTESTLYPVLKRLENAGQIAVRTSEHKGRLRKYYHLTPAGEARLTEFIAERAQIRDIYDYIEGYSGKDSAHE